METQFGKVTRTLCAVAALIVSSAYARQVNVSTVADLTSATLNAKAGDTIWVASGKYELPTSNCTNDTFVNSTGRDCGLIWLGADGTKANPVVLAGSDPTNPPEIYSSDYKHNYGIHVTGDYVILKNLKIHSFSKGVVFDNSVGALMEDCEVYHTGNEIVHVRDSSQQVTLNRNFIHGSGYETARYGEGIYVGTYNTGWASSQQSDRDAGYWGTDASQHRYSGYDWRVNDTKITCNIVMGTTAENIDVKEGTVRGIVQGNMFVGDSLDYNGQVSYDDANIDMKGAYWTVTGNYFYNSKKQGLPYYNPHFNYFVEEVVMPSNGNKTGSNIEKYEKAVGDVVSVDKYAQKGWCDSSGTDKNDCVESKNHVVEEIRDVRNDCEELFKISQSGIEYSSSSTAGLSSSSVQFSSSSEALVSSSSVIVYQGDKYEAESATYTGCTLKTNQAASGGYYMRTETTGNITFNINVPAAGQYEVVIRFSNTAANAKTQDIYVNGSKVKSQQFPVTLEGNLGGAAAAFEDMPVQVSLNAGANTFGIIKNWGHVDVDYIEVKVPSTGSSSSAVTPSSSAAVSSSAASPVSSASVKPASSNSTTALPSIAGTTFRVQVSGNLVQITGAMAGQPFAVLDMQGRVLRSGRVPASGMSVRLDRSGVYMVKVGASVQTISLAP